MISFAVTTPVGFPVHWLAELLKSGVNYITRLFVRLNAASVTNEEWRGMKLEQSLTHLITMRNRQGNYPNDTKTFESGSSAASSHEGHASPPEERHAHRPDEPGTSTENQVEDY